MFDATVKIIIAIGVLLLIIGIAVVLFLRHDDEELVRADEEYEATSEIPEIAEPAADIPEDTVIRIQRFDWIGYQEWKRAKLRAESPHLYKDNWYARSRQDFSYWAVKQAEIQADEVRLINEGYYDAA